jgi:hypothetical protein
VEDEFADLYHPREVKRLDPKACEGLGAGILKRHGEESRYQDARKAEGPRRLGVVARDVGRLVDRFEDDKAVTAKEGVNLLAPAPAVAKPEPGKEYPPHELRVTTETHFLRWNQPLEQ